MLSTRGIGIPDRALGPYVHPDWVRDCRIVDRVAVCEGLTDRVAWQYLCEAAAARRGRVSALECYRVIYGPKGKR